MNGSPARRGPSGPVDVTPAARRLLMAREHERAGRMDAAAREYESAIEASERLGDDRTLAESLRLLGVVRQRARDCPAARTLCERSYAVAARLGDRVLAAQALNTLGAFELESGHTDSAREIFLRALPLGDASPGLRGRIEQNLGIIANIQGDLVAALDHYRRSLTSFESAGEDDGCAIAYHNLGMISADQQQWQAAEEYFSRSLALANAQGDVRLRGLCLLNRTEVLLAGQRFEDARASAESALQLFDELGAFAQKADAYKFLGVLYRETGRPVLSEARFTAAIQLAAGAGAILGEAEASRELAQLYRQLGRNRDALRLLNAAHRLFVELGAQGDVGDVATKMATLEGVYLSIVREWGQSIESADSYTHGHCERVAEYAVAVAQALRLSEEDCATIRVGAYLHDVGKVRVPHEILNKPGRLTSAEREIMELHPLYGLELLEGIEFPWDIRPIIRWHHEKLDGTGYPDRLRGEEIPLIAQVVGIADVYDALTTTRSYRAAMTTERAMEELSRCRQWWRSDVFDALLSGVIGEAMKNAA